MTHPLRLPLWPMHRFRQRERLWWLLAGALWLLILILVLEQLLAADGFDPNMIFVSVLVALGSGLAVWHARRLRRLQACLRAAGWDELRARLTTLPGLSLAAALSALDLPAGSEPVKMAAPGTDGAASKTKLAIHDGLSVVLQDREGVVRSATVSLEFAGTPVDATGLLLPVAMGTLLIVVDVLLFGAPIFSMLLGLWLVLIWLPLSLLPWFGGQRYPRLRNLTLYMIAIVVSFAAVGLNDRVAEHRADRLVEAVKSYRTKYARYPRSLEELVPEFIERVPAVKYGFGLVTFDYFPEYQSGAERIGPVLGYHESIYIRRAYTFKDGTWGRRGWR